MSHCTVDHGTLRQTWMGDGDLSTTAMAVGFVAGDRGNLAPFELRSNPRGEEMRSRPETILRSPSNVVGRAQENAGEFV